MQSAPRERRDGCIAGEILVIKSFETHHLQTGEVFLPPDELLVLGSERGDQVVTVHDNVHEGIEQSEEAAVAAGGELDSEPHRQGHHTVVNNVQGRDVVALFAHNEEELQRKIWLVYFLSKSALQWLTVSKNSVNLEKKYHQHPWAILTAIGSFE